MKSSAHPRDPNLDSSFWSPSFPVVMAAVVFVLSTLYALTFSHMVYLSLAEQVFPHEHGFPRYAGPPHYHNSVEWALLVAPAAIGWLGLVGSLIFLTRRAREHR